MRYISILVAVFLLNFDTVVSAEAPAPNDIPRLAAIKGARFNQKQTIVKSLAGGPVTIVCEVPIEVSVTVGEEGTVIRWRRGEIKITDVDVPALRNKPEMKKAMIESALRAQPILSAMDNLTFELGFDKEFAYTGLKNLPEVEADARKSIEGIDKVRAQQGLGPIEENVKAAIFNRDFIEQTFPKDVLNYIAWTMIRVQRGATTRVKVSMPNPLGGEATPGILTARLDEKPDDQRRLVLHVDTKMDIEKFARTMEQTLARTPGAKPLSPEDKAAMSKVKVTSLTQYHIDPDTGLASRVVHKTDVSVADQSKSEEFEWTMIR